MPKRPKQDLQPITPSRLNKLMFLILSERKVGGKKREFLRFRNAFMLYFGWHLGLRPKEIYDCRIEHLNLKEKTLYIPAQNNKQRQQDYIYLPDFMIEKLIIYLRYRNALYGNNYNGWLFPSSGKYGRLDRSTFGRMLRAALKKAGFYQISYIDRQGNKRANLHLYSLRCGFGTYACERLGIRKAQLLMRHRDVRSTLRYYQISEELTRKELINELYLKT